MAPNFSQATPDRALRFSILSAVNRNVGGSNPPRGANSLFMQRVANIFRKLCPLVMKCQVHESRLISINEDEGKSTRAGVSEVDQINRGQPRSIAVNRGQSRSNQAFGSKPNARQLAGGGAPACQAGVPSVVGGGVGL